MQPFCEEQRRKVKSLMMNSQSPGVDEAFAVTHAQIQNSISKVAADLLDTYIEMDRLPKRVACLYMICNVLNVVLGPTALNPPLSNV